MADESPDQLERKLIGKLPWPGWTPKKQRKIDAMWADCPHCGMEAGMYCVTEWGSTAYTPHKARFDAVGGKL